MVRAPSFAGIVLNTMSDEIFPADEHIAELKRAIEASVMVAQDPVAPELLAQLLEQPVGAVETWCEELKAEYAAQNRGFEFCRVAGGYRYQSHPDLTPYVERFVLHDQKARLSGAALETLAIIAYKQPISRAQIASIRGVDPDGVIRTLQRRGYVDEIGRDDGPGQAALLGTTAAFLEKLGLDSIDDLPPIAEFIPGADVVETLEQGLRISPDSELAERANGDGTVAGGEHPGRVVDGDTEREARSDERDPSTSESDQSEPGIDTGGAAIPAELDEHPDPAFDDSRTGDVAGDAVGDATTVSRENATDGGEGRAGRHDDEERSGDGAPRHQPGADDDQIGPEGNGD